MSNRLVYGPANALRYGPLRAFQSDEKAFRAGQWARAALFGDDAAEAWCRKNGVPLTRAQGEGTNTAGGFLVPPEMASTIITRREVHGAFRSSAEIAPMARDAMDWPRRTGGVTAYWVGENQQITESQTTLGSVGLVAKKIAALTRTSSELEEDSAADLGDFLAEEMAYAFAVKEDLAGFNGDGTAPYGGIVGVCPTLLDGNHTAGKISAAAGHDSFAEIDMTDLSALIAALPAFALPGAAWFVSQYAFAMTLFRLAATTGGITMMPDRRDGTLRPHFATFPVVLSQALPQVGSSLANSIMLLFGDLRLASVLGDRRIMGMARSEDRFFDTDQIAFRGSERIDIVNHSLGDNTTAGAVVGLVGAS